MVIIRDLGLQNYSCVWEEMKTFTANRQPTTGDEFWLVEHFPVYTQGQAGKVEHLLNTNTIEVVQSDRGGQVTYHGPGQLVCYVLVDLKRLQLGIRSLVTKLERILIAVLKTFNITAQNRDNAPGVYVQEKKIASIGLRVKNGCTYHGIALNVDMDLTPFNGINPCGFANLQMTQIRLLQPDITLSAVKKRLQSLLIAEWDTLTLA